MPERGWTAVSPAVVRCMIRSGSKSQVKPGQVLLTSEPFVYLLKSKFLRERCTYCLQSAVTTGKNLQRCSGCQTMYFCNQDCQRSAWNQFHRFECRRLKAVAPKYPPDTALYLARLIKTLQNGGAKVSERITETRQRSYRDLMSHYRDIKACPRRMEHFSSLCVVLRSFLGETGLPNTADLMGMYGRILVNSFNILDGDMMPLAVGLYLAPSIIDHSCEPNAVAVFVGKTIHIRAVHDIDNFTWDKVRISYIDMLADRETRQQELRDGYFFTCDCVRCTGPEFSDLERAIKCGKPDCPAPVILPSRPAEGEEGESEGVKCQRCRYNSYSDDIYEQFQQVEQLTRQSIQDMKDTVYFDLCKLCLERQKSLFHPLNVYHVKMLDLALEVAITAEMWERSLDLGEEVLDGYRKYYGCYHPVYGVLLLKLGKIALYRFKHQLADRYLREAGHVLSVSHGHNHPLCTEQLAPLIQQVLTETAFRPHGP